MPTTAAVTPPDRLVAARPGLGTAAALLAVVSLGLTWGERTVGTGQSAATIAVLGTQHPVRVLLPVAAALAWWGLTRDRHGPAWAGVALGVFALPLEPAGGTLAPGRLVFAVAVILTAVALAAGASHRTGTGPG